ncbi:hypothetical protein Pmani_027842 [Petrolisthes manimaculis]|uniref:Dolichyl-diphosphooligosaccharide--protein glycosyltransferase subunit DAD1 n=1 Tax=Petrolisthes manimaculis TaxID=1843537 RepID=A0AAE1P3I6_9EUCA|nr:hypothetical protein Pmani_027842 [Petrolisthes manimaculis]
MTLDSTGHWIEGNTVRDGSSRDYKMSSTTLIGVVRNFLDEYMRTTPKKLKMVDAYLSYVLMTGILQFVYCCLVGTFPFNSFLSGFICTVGCFVLGVSLRLQANPQNRHQFVGVSPERGFADFVFAHIILHLVTVNFIG